MHCTVLTRWVVLPALIVSASGAVSVSTPYVDAAEQTVDSAIKSVHIDENSAQASFVVPCYDCTGTHTEGAVNQSFLFNLQAFPSQQPCGSNNLSLNGIPLLQEWESTGVHGQGLAYIASSGHDLNVSLTSDCLYVLEEDQSLSSATQLLTVSIEAIDKENTRSLSGFTLSFKQYPTPELLRLSLAPDFSARDLPDSETWRDPPATLRIPASAPDTTSEANGRKLLSLEEQLNDLRQLEEQANKLIKLIEQKREFINAQISDSANKSLKEDIKDCESFLCVVKTIGNHVHDAAHAVYLKFHASNQPYTQWQASAGGQSPAMIPVSDFVKAPEQCHCTDGQPSAPASAMNGTAVVPSEKTPAYNASQPYGTNETKWKDATRPSIFIVVLKFLFVITGLALIFRLLRRCFISDRRRAERAAERERRATERLYRCAAAKQSWRDWWQGKKRGKPGYRPGDYVEKRGLIIEQEKILEGAMQVEIQQLRIQEEIRQLRSTRDAVDDLVRAEEGRSIPPTYAAAAASASSSSSHPFGFHPVPAPITIPPPTSGMYPSYHSESHPGTPLSRTSSLPDYKTDASSEPPGYESDRRSSFSHDGYYEYAHSEYAHSTHTTESAWSPESSIPDLSPRHSVETSRTIETARTFL